MPEPCALTCASCGVPQALAARLVRLIDFYEDTIAELRAQCGGEGEEGGGGGAPR